MDDIGDYAVFISLTERYHFVRVLVRHVMSIRVMVLWAMMQCSSVEGIA
jgi:hypothetical protein